jgi:hypothetical protein
MVPFSQQKNKRMKIRQAYNMICQLAGSSEEAANLINELHKKVNPISNRSNEVNKIIVENLRWILDHHPEPRPFRTVLASLVTRDGITLDEASKVTGVSSSTISFHNQRPKEELLNGLVYRVSLFVIYSKENFIRILLFQCRMKSDNVMHFYYTDNNFSRKNTQNRNGMGYQVD